VIWKGKTIDEIGNFDMKLESSSCKGSKIYIFHVSFSVFGP
jgi:hypothetical protein